MKAYKVRLKDLAGAMSMDNQPVCLSISTAIKYTLIEDEDEKDYYNSVCGCGFSRRSERLNDTEFMKIVEKYGNYYVWDISVFEDDFGTPYLIISAVKNKA